MSKSQKPIYVKDLFEEDFISYWFNTIFDTYIQRDNVVNRNYTKAKKEDSKSLFEPLARVLGSEPYKLTPKLKYQDYKATIETDPHYKYFAHKEIKINKAYKSKKIAINNKLFSMQLNMPKLIEYTFITYAKEMFDEKIEKLNWSTNDKSYSFYEEIIESCLHTILNNTLNAIEQLEVNLNDNIGSLIQSYVKFDAIYHTTEKYYQVAKSRVDKTTGKELDEVTHEKLHFEKKLDAIKLNRDEFFRENITNKNLKISQGGDNTTIPFETKQYYKIHKYLNPIVSSLKKDLKGLTVEKDLETIIDIVSYYSLNDEIIDYLDIRYEQPIIERVKGLINDQPRISTAKIIIDSNGLNIKPKWLCERIANYKKSISK